jgi:hypothetical protein
MFENLKYQLIPVLTSLLTLTLRTMDVQALLCTPKTPRIREIPNTLDILTRSSRAFMQSWDS